MAIAADPSVRLRAGARPGAVARAASLLADPRRAACAAVVLLSAVVGLDALGDPDVWWHLRLGQWALANHRVPTSELLSYTVNGSPVVPHEWLSDVLFAALAAAGGLFLVALFMAAVCWSGFIAIGLRSRMRGAGVLAIAAGLALAAKAAEPVLGTRPQVFTFAFVCWLLFVVERHLRRGGRAVWLLPLLFVLWANLHAGFVAGLGLLAAIVVIEAVKRVVHIGELADTARIRTVGVVTGLSVVAACLNPVGPAIYRFALSEATTEGSKGIIEWAPPNFADPGLWALLALLVTFAMLLLRAALRRRLDPRDAVLGGIAAVMALLAVRNTSIFVAVAAPVWSALIADAARGISKRRGSRPSRALVTPSTVGIGALIVAAAVGAVAYSVTRLQTSASAQGVAAVYPACAADVLAESSTPQRVFTQYADGGFVANRIWPRGFVYIYGNSETFSLSMFQRYYRIANDAQTAPTGLQLLQQSGTTAVLFPRGALTDQLARTPGWTWVLSDDGRELFVRGSSAWTAGTAC
ncbi:MAG: hypothetical protein JOY68_04785 [Candidatus Dormibacteraeota bacterium]|nr:hypothetical protein [Candidatus Dormibacteraeota bacterium]